MKTKRCTQCGRDLPITEFHRRQHYVRSGVRAACKDCTREAAKEAARTERNDRDRLKDQVRAKTRQAIERGELVPQPCRVCGHPDAQAHHRRYEGDGAHLDVEWLCIRHHALEHGTNPWTKQVELFPAG
jgi:hypothetical protein